MVVYGVAAESQWRISHPVSDGGVPIGNSASVGWVPCGLIQEKTEKSMEIE